MSDADNSSFADFGKFVPGFDFLKNLTTQAAGSAIPKIPNMPNLGSWVAPTLNVEELDKRIQELKAVQFWLDQNALALKATIQALEVQKMTLATLKGMNFHMADVANAFKLKMPDSAPQAADKSKSFPGLEIPPTSFSKSKSDQDSASSASSSATTPAAGGVVDPMQWWGALTQQFQTIAADALKDTANKTSVDTTNNLTTGLATNAIKTATSMAKDMAESAQKTVAGGALAAMNTALRSSQAWPLPLASKTAAPAKSRSTTSAASKPKPAAKPAVKAARKTSR